MKSNTRKVRTGRPAPTQLKRPNEPSPPTLYHLGDEIIFKYEGNIRARVVGFETVRGESWPVTRATLEFTIPPSLIVGVEGEG
jgi:hypothetical protein